MSIDLARERRKLLWLKGKVAQQEQWVRELEARSTEPVDPLDRALEEAFDHEHGKPVQASALGAGDVAEAHSPLHAEAQFKGLAPSVRVGGPWAKNWTREVRRLPPKWASIIEHIGAEGKSLTEVIRFVELRALHLTPDTLRAGLMNYRRDFGLLENPKRGRYVATQKALDIIAATKDESLTDGEASESQSPEKEAAHTA